MKREPRGGLFSRDFALNKLPVIAKAVVILGSECKPAVEREKKMVLKLKYLC